MITTIDDNSSLEAYIQVPLDRTPDLKAGLTVQLLDSENKPIATNTITFIAPRVDDATQTVLVKSLLRDAPPALRSQQFARARVIWRTAPGLTIPLTAVLRINGQYFCYVAEPGEGGALVAKQRPLEVGEMIGNDYVVKSGLKTGERIVTSGIQKLGNGAPVKPE
jgi:RND family efflux transporter MFP subunit